MFASIIKGPLAKLINMMKGRGSKNRRLDDAEILEFYATKDWEINRDTTPPDEERIDLICMWAGRVLHCVAYGQSGRRFAAIRRNRPRRFTHIQQSSNMGQRITSTTFWRLVDEFGT